MKPLLWIIIPCYNEETVLPITAPQFLEELHTMITHDKISDRSRICFVNDGSSDSTWQIISKLAEEDSHYIGISESRNIGHQNALLSGLMEARDKCDVTISIDCDGQDDISVMEQMIDDYLAGSEVVYGVRSDRSTDTFFKRFSAERYYKMLNRMGVEAVYNHADYRLISSMVLDELANFEEVNLFLRGMVPLAGFPSSSVSYERKKREAGKSHYSFGKMTHLAVDGITSLSIRPLHIIAMMGILFSFIGFIGIVWAFISYFTNSSVAGWASLICVICFLGGIQLLSLGVIGEYIGKMYMETKHRPRYIISERTWKKRERKYKG